MFFIKEKFNFVYEKVWLINRLLYNEYGLYVYNIEYRLNLK